MLNRQAPILHPLTASLGVEVVVGGGSNELTRGSEQRIIGR